MLRHSTNDRLVERAMARDEKQSRSWHPPRPLVRHKKKHRGYGQFESDSDEDDESDSGSDDDEGSGDEAGSALSSKEGSRVGFKAGSRLSAGASSSSASSSPASSSSASSSSSTRDPRAGIFRVPMDPRKYDPSLAHHASRLTVLRPRHLRERFDRPDVDFNHR